MRISGISGALVSWLNEKHPVSRNLVDERGFAPPGLLVANTDGKVGWNEPE